jgi:IS5 family transposase
MHLKRHIGKLSIEECYVLFGGKLDPNNSWAVFSSLMLWEELDQAYAFHLSSMTGALAKTVRLAFGALFIKQRLSLTD